MLRFPFIVPWLCAGVVVVLGGECSAQREHVSRVNLGWTKAQVEAAIGQPDRTVKQENDVEWRYGCAGEWKFPLGGTVVFNEAGRVRSVYGAGKSPKFLPERAVARIIPRLAEPLTIGENYAPNTMIQMVNLLQPMGKKGAIALLEEYRRLSPQDSLELNIKISLILRCLFNSRKPPPPFAYGELAPPQIPAADIAPRYPLQISRGIPFLLIYGVSIEGLAPDCSDDIEFYRKHGVIRATPLVAGNPQSALADACDSPAWTRVKRSDGNRFVLALQYLKVVRPNLQSPFAEAEKVVLSEDWLATLVKRFPPQRRNPEKTSSR